MIRRTVSLIGVKRTKTFTRSALVVVLTLMLCFLSSFEAAASLSWKDGSTGNELKTFSKRTDAAGISCAKIRSLRNTKNGIIVYWNKVAGATGYYVYNYVNGSWNRAATIWNANTTSWEDKSVNTHYGKYIGYVVDAFTGSVRSNSTERTYIYRMQAPVQFSVGSGGAGRISVKWSKVSGADGYQIQCAPDKEYLEPKYVAAKSGSAVSFKISDLSYRRYWVRMRSYRLVNGERQYSAWTTSKTTFPGTGTSGSNDLKTKANAAYKTVLQNRSKRYSVRYQGWDQISTRSVNLTAFPYSKTTDINGDGIPELLLSNYRQVTSGINSTMIMTYYDNKVVPLLLVDSWGGGRFGVYITKNLLVTVDSGSKDYCRYVYRIKNGRLETVQTMLRSWDDFYVNGKKVPGKQGAPGKEWLNALNAYNTAGYSKLTF